MPIPAIPITADAYRPYGDLLSADREDVAARDANQGTAARRNHLIDLRHDRPHARANFSSFRCAPRTAWPMPLALLEKHPHSTQAFIPMNASRYVVVVALGGDAPDLATLRAFVVGGGAAVSYGPGVWHHPMIALDRVTDFACLVWEDGTAEDAVEHSLAGQGVAIELPNSSPLAPLLVDKEGEREEEPRSSRSPRLARRGGGPGGWSFHEDPTMNLPLNFRRDFLTRYSDVLGPPVLDALAALAPFDAARRVLMSERLVRRAARAKDCTPPTFLEPAARISRTGVTVAEARAGQFEGAEIPHDLERQWIQGTGPATRPRAPLEEGLRNVAYALLSGADGWMFDGEDALGQVDAMALDNQRNLKLALAGDSRFLGVAENVAAEMNAWAKGFLGRETIESWKKQLDFTTRIFRARGLHLDDRNIRHEDGKGFSASIADAVLYVVNNAATLRTQGRSIVLYLPKIQTPAEAALWNDILGALEAHVGIPHACIRTYVLVEQLEASFALLEIRAALGKRFVGFNTGRWDYINSVADAMAWDRSFVNPNIDAITMTYGYMRNYEDRVRRAVNTPDKNGCFALWQGGMEPNIPVGSAAGVKDGMRRAVLGAEREEAAGASGKWVAHWKMVHIVRPVWERAGRPNQMGRAFPPLEHTREAAAKLIELEAAPRTVRGARDLLSVGLQYGNAFGRGFQAAALKAADFFGNDDVLYLMEDAATGEIRLSILWEWLHKGGAFTEADAGAGVKAGDVLTPALFTRLLEEEYAKLRVAGNRDVHDDSKETTLPIARAIVEAYVQSDAKPPWYIDYLNVNLETFDLALAQARIAKLIAALRGSGERVTENLDFQIGG